MIFEDYVDKDNLDAEALSKAAIEGIIEALDDPYTAYMDAEHYRMNSSDLEGKFDGYALRVPTPTVSIVDFVAEVEKPVTVEELNAAFKAAADGPLKGILGFCTEPLVSMDFKGDSRSSIIDAENTMVMGGTMVKVVTWYDNEWGYSCRTADLAAKMAKSL